MLKTATKYRASCAISTAADLRLVAPAADSTATPSSAQIAVGGANYEWIQDCLLERFFSVDSPPYVVVSGTFRMSQFAGRDSPYFFYPPRRLKEALDLALESLDRFGR